MGDRNSLVAYYATLVSNVYTDIAHCYPVSHVITVRELTKLTLRLSREGLSFMTKTLPRLGKAFDKALSMKTPFNPPGFEKIRGTTTPKFLGWLFSRVFDNAGVVLDDVDIMAVKHIRQFVYLLYKLELPYASDDEQKVIDAFVATEADLQNLEISPRDPVIKSARTFVTRVLGCLDPLDIVPMHGPGAVATGEKGLCKADFARIYGSVEEVYPTAEYFFYNLSHVVDEFQAIESWKSEPHGTAKVVLVPKDSRGPRLISCEPLELQWLQQGLARSIVARLETCPLTKGHVNFSDQVVNQRLALLSSQSQQWVTLDMKEASDRVSLRLVNELFSGTQLLRGLIATRSQATKLPDGRLIHMDKFAPMGSALCFPVEAFVFYALSVAVLAVYGKLSLAQARESVYVYGDDLIIRAEVYQHVLQHLPRFGLLFNEDKCCTAGFFRESCGCDAFKGVDVTPIKLKTVWDCSRRIGPGVLASSVSYSNSLMMAGYSLAAQFIEDEINRVYPYVPINNNVHLNTSKYDWRSETPHGISFYRPGIRAMKANRTPIRWNDEFHRMEVLTPIIVPQLFKGWGKSGWREMLRRTSRPSLHNLPGLYTLPRRVKMTRGWTPLVD